MKMLDDIPLMLRRAKQAEPAETPIGLLASVVLAACMIAGLVFFGIAW